MQRQWIAWATVLTVFGLAISQLFRNPYDYLRVSSSLPQSRDAQTVKSKKVVKEGGATTQADPEEQRNLEASQIFFEALTLQNSSPQEAISLLKEVLQENPKFESAHERLSEIYVELKDFEAARSASSACLNVNSRNISCHHSLVRSMIAEEGIGVAKAAVDDCLKAVPDDFICLQKLRDYYLTLEDGDGFDRSLANLLRLRARSLRAELLSEAMFYSEVGESAKANARLISVCDMGDEEACKVLEDIRTRKY